MEKRKKPSRYLKNRTWKSKIAHRLKGHPQEVCQDYLYGALDAESAGNTREKQKKF